MQIVQTVTGVFHHFELAHQLNRRGYLKKLYSTFPWSRLKREGLDHSLVETFPVIHPVSYLLNRARLVSPEIHAHLDRLSSRSFDWWTSHRVQSCDALIGISGTSLHTGGLVQRRGGKFICDRGSTHHRYQQLIVQEEHLRWRMSPPIWDQAVTDVEERSYEIADAITVPSHVALRSFIALGIPAKKMHVIPYGVRLDHFYKRDDPPKNAFHLLFAGSVSLRKGVPYLLQAFAQLRHPHKHLTMVGAVQENIRPLLAQLPREHVTFRGALPQAQLALLMSQSHLLVLPSIEEGLALVQSQAMAAGCPILATPETGAEDLFSDGVEGLLVPSRDVESLLSGMQRIADDALLQKRMGAAAQDRVKSLGGWDHYGDLWERLLLQIISGTDVRE